jgi:tetratricopeptide (TPR) repeat protein
MYDESMRSLESAKLSLPNDPMIRYHLGMVYSKKNMKTNALAELNKALEIDKNLSSAVEVRRTIKELGG